MHIIRYINGKSVTQSQLKHFQPDNRTISRAIRDTRRNLLKSKSI